MTNICQMCIHVAISLGQFYILTKIINTEVDAVSPNGIFFMFDILPITDIIFQCFTEYQLAFFLKYRQGPFFCKLTDDIAIHYLLRGLFKTGIYNFRQFFRLVTLYHS